MPLIISGGERRLLSSAPSSPSSASPMSGDRRRASWVSRSMRKRLRLMRRMGQQRLTRSIWLLVAFLTFWLAAGGLFLVYRSQSSSSEDIQEIAALKEAERREGPIVLQTRPESESNDEGEEGEGENEQDHNPALHERLIGLAAVPATEIEIAWKNPPQGGPVLVRHTMRPQKYENSSARRLHGRLGLNSSGPLWHENGESGSRGIPLDRVTADLKPPACKKVHFDLTRLPEVSVIIPFRDVEISLLLRSLHSVLNLTPPSLLKEVILVDDASVTSEISGGFLERYVESLPQKVKILRRESPGGIVAARLAGVEAATADLFALLSPYVEMQPKWLEPLALRIQQNRKIVVMPMIDLLSDETLDPTGEIVGPSMGLTWDLQKAQHFKRRSPPESPTAFIETPILSHGTFVAHRDWFVDMGGFDRKMKDGNAADIEVSLRLWQCGGKLEYAPCSRVFLVDAKAGESSTGERDRKRVAAAWMDDFYQLISAVSGWNDDDELDVSERLALRQAFHCKSFSWFLKEVWPESDMQAIPEDVPYLGMLRNVESNSCLEVFYKKQHPQMVSCTNRTKLMFIRKTGKIVPVSQLDLCLHSDATFKTCEETGDGESENSSDTSSTWEVTETGAIQLAHANLCLSANANSAFPTVVPCATERKGFRGGVVSVDSQSWQWDKFTLHI